jgi:hypothetical protein
MSESGPVFILLLLLLLLLFLFLFNNTLHVLYGTKSGIVGLSEFLSFFLK